MTDRDTARPDNVMWGVEGDLCVCVCVCVCVCLCLCVCEGSADHAELCANSDAIHTCTQLS